VGRRFEVRPPPLTQSRIHSTMKELLFRLNQQQHRNEKYKETREKRLSTESDLRGSSTEHPIEVDVREASLTNVRNL
jgi:hypothetical protein